MKKFLAIFLAILFLIPTVNVVSAQDGCPKGEEGWICETVSESPTLGSTVGLSGHGLPVTTVYINGIFYYEDTLENAVFYIYGMGTEMVSVTTNDEYIIEIGWSTNPIATATPISTATPIVTNTPSSTTTVQEIAQKTQQSPIPLITGIIIIAAIVGMIIFLIRRKGKK